LIRSSTWQGILGLTALATVSWLVSLSPTDQEQEERTAVDTRLNYALRNFESRMLDEQGNVKLEMSSPILRKIAESEVGTIESPVIRIQQENEEWYISAESAIITADREFVSLIGDVDLLRTHTITGETLEINTYDVMLRTTPRTASTESPVTLIQSGDRVDAIGMNLDMINNSYELLEDVRAHYDTP
jgi:LPS export ABC transporter protein LptC